MTTPINTSSCQGLTLASIPERLRPAALLRNGSPGQAGNDERGCALFLLAGVVASKAAALELSTFSLRSAGSAAKHRARGDPLDEAEMDKAAPDPLTAIRNHIDAIDAEIHRLLIGRSGVIAELIRLKGLSKPGAAFRPDREADMMRRLVLRHEGELPLVTVEHIWREIITTFTAMQAPFGVVAGPAEDPLALRDAIRFYFGFSVPVTNCQTAEAAIARVAASGQDIAVIAADEPGRWWDGLAGAGAPKILAKLPFIEIPHRPADLPAYVIGPPLKETAVPDIRVVAMADGAGLEAAIVAHGGAIVGRAGADVLVELPIAATFDDLAAVAGRPAQEGTSIGGFHQPIRLVADRVP
jgi:chorismate mutase